MEIEVLDVIMGSGKTHATLRYIENLAINNKQECWIYATEFLDEINKRTAENTLAAGMWRSPEKMDNGNKTDDFIFLLKEPKVQLIAITHALLKQASSQDYVNFLIKEKGYKLFLDETMDLINSYADVKPGDFLSYLKDGKLSIDQNDGKVTWLADDNGSDGKPSSFDKLRKDSGKGIVHCAISSGSVGNNSVSLVEINNENLFKQFSRVIVATYQIENTLFHAYCVLKGFDFIPCKDVHCSKTTTKQGVINNIEWINKYNEKFRLPCSMSTGWWEGTNKKHVATKQHFRLLNNAIKNIGNTSGCKGNPSLLGFTVPSSILGKQKDAKAICPVGYPHTVSAVVIDADGNEKVTNARDKQKSTYIPCSARASNEYVCKTVMIHAYSRFISQPVERYLHSVQRDIFSNEAFATNEIIQWVWRSAIREGKPIKLAILDERMRGLFIDWLAKE